MLVMFGCCFAKKVRARLGLADVVQVSNDTVMILLKRVFQCGSREQNGMVVWCAGTYGIYEITGNRINTSSFGIPSKSASMAAEWNLARGNF